MPFQSLTQRNNYIMKKLILIITVLLTCASFNAQVSKVKVDKFIEEVKASIRNQDLESLMSSCLLTSDDGKFLREIIANEKGISEKEYKRSLKDDYVLDIYKNFYKAVVEVNKNLGVFATVTLAKESGSSSNDVYTKAGINSLYKFIDIKVLSHIEGSIKPKVNSFRVNNVVEYKGELYFIGEVRYWD